MMHSVQSFRAKLVLWNSLDAVNGSYEMFPNTMAADSEKKSAGFDSETLEAISRKNELLFS